MTDTAGDRTDRQREAADNLRQVAQRRASLAGVPAELVEREPVAEQQGVSRAVETEDRTGAAFFRCVRRGGQRVLILNAAHPFYLEVYWGGTTARQRAALEILLWTLGEAEVDADPDSDLRRWYVHERATVWSPNLAGALTALTDEWM